MEPWFWCFSPSSYFKRLRQLLKLFSMADYFCIIHSENQKLAIFLIYLKQI